MARKKVNDTALEEVKGGVALEELAQKADMLDQRVNALEQKTDMLSEKITTQDKGKVSIFKKLFG